MAQRLHLVFGGGLAGPARGALRNAGGVHVARTFPDRRTARSARNAAAQRTAGNARMRHSVARLRLRPLAAAARRSGPTRHAPGVPDGDVPSRMTHGRAGTRAPATREMRP